MTIASNAAIASMASALPRGAGPILMMWLI